MASVQRKDVMKFTDYDVFGFDMDFTLARYELVPFFKLSYGCLCKFLTEKKGYGAEIFKGFDDIKYIVCAALIADYEKGNIIKLDENGSVIRALHGTRQMSDKEISDIYGDRKLFPYMSQFSNENGLKSSDKTWRFHDNLFDIPGMAVYAQLVDYLELKPERPTTSDFLHCASELLEGFEDMYVPTQFANHQGNYFPELKANPSKYIDRMSEDIRNWLKSLKRDGKIVFFLTTSFPDYASHLMNTVIGPEWKTYFDLVIYGARKPRFFTESKPFIRIENCQALEEVQKLEAGKEYCHGNFQVLSTFLQQVTKKAEPKVVYFGDNLIADACPSTLLAKWDSVLILEEMDAEGYAVTDGTVPGHEDEEEEDTAVVSAKKKRRYEHSSLITEEEIDLVVSSTWGSIFYDDDATSGDIPEDDMRRMNTTYGYLIAKYATICVPSIEYLTGVPLDHEYSTFSSERGNTRGFHPGKPKSLLPQ